MTLVCFCFSLFIMSLRRDGCHYRTKGPIVIFLWCREVLYEPHHQMSLVQMRGSATRAVPDGDDVVCLQPSHHKKVDMIVDARKSRSEINIIASSVCFRHKNCFYCRVWLMPELSWMPIRCVCFDANELWHASQHHRPWSAFLRRRPCRRDSLPSIAVAENLKTFCIPALKTSRFAIDSRRWPNFGRTRSAFCFNPSLVARRRWIVSTRSVSCSKRLWVSEFMVFEDIPSASQAPRLEISFATQLWKSQSST